MHDRRFRGGIPLALLLAAGSALGAVVLAEEAVAEPEPAGASIDKSRGEVDQIRMRAEWFYSTRRSGTTSDQELWRLRLDGVKQTRDALKRQREERSAGGKMSDNQWVSMGPSPSTFGGWAFGTISGRIQAIAADWDGGVLYAGAAAGGVWKSTNEGLSWTSIFDSAGTVAVGAIEIDPNDANVLWVGTGDNIVGCESYFGIGLLRSPDGGASWELRNGSGSELDLSSFANIKIDPRDSNKLVVGGRYRGCVDGNQQEGGIFTSTDGGMSWTSRLPGNAQVHEIERDPVVPDILWAGTNDGVYKSVNNGLTWILQTNSGLPSGSLGRTEIAVAPSDPNTVYVLFDHPSDQFWRTQDGGATWTMMNADACDGQCSYNMVIRVHSMFPDVVYRGTVLVHKSFNGGSSWSALTTGWGSQQTVHQDIQSMLVHPTEVNTLYVGSDGGIWKGTNAGNTFTNINGNLNVTQFYAIGVDANDPGRICGGAQDNSSLATNNNTVWTRQAVTGDGFVCHLDPVDSNYAYIASYPLNGFPSIWRSTSGLFGSFNSITGSGSGVAGGDRINWVTPYALDPNNPAVLYLGTHRAYRSDDRGNSWTQLGPDLSGDGTSSLLTMEINRNFPSVVYSGSAGGAVFRTASDGANWTNITAGLPDRSINDVAGDPTNADRAFVALGGFNSAHVFEWNLGSGWTARSTGLPNVPANTVVMLTDLDILVGTDTGIFRSVNGGLSFHPYMSGLPEGVIVTDLIYSELQHVVTAGTYGRGVWQASVGPPQPLLFPESVEQPPIEIDGDGDDKIEPGETWSVRPILRNAGGVGAPQVTARLASATPGVTVLSPDVADYGDLDPGVTSPSLVSYRFTVDPSFPCGDTISFDLMDLASSSPLAAPTEHTGVYTPVVQGGTAPPVVTSIFDQNFDPAPASGWGHEVVDTFDGECALFTQVDEWKLESKDATHGISFHAGNGPGATYSQFNSSWLHPIGKDSEAGQGWTIPTSATTATLTLVHWYDTIAGRDGGQVAIDALPDGQDVYTPLEPAGGYPGLTPADGCNALVDQEVFDGSSGGWVTSVFNLTPYRGQQFFLSFVFGADRGIQFGEGWYIDEVRIEYHEIGSPVCDLTPWPGAVESAHFNLVDPATIEATWDDACNVGDFPGQTYSIQVGNLDVLAATGNYSHLPVDDLCSLTSPGGFSPGPGNEYYLIIPAGGGKEGGAGGDSAGTDRPQIGAVCGERRADCP